MRLLRRLTTKPRSNPSEGNTHDSEVFGLYRKYPNTCEAKSFVIGQCHLESTGWKFESAELGGKINKQDFMYI